MGLLIIGVILLVVLSAFKSVPKLPLKSTTPIRIVAIGLDMIGTIKRYYCSNWVGRGRCACVVWQGKRADTK